MSTNNNHFTMNLHLNKMQYLDINLRAAATGTEATETENPSPTASPPDFDFNLPCRYFKSSFARSLSLNSTSNHCRSLDYSENNKSVAAKNLCPAFFQRVSRASPPAAAVAAFSTGNESNNLLGNGNILVQNEGSCDNNKPPPIPARRLSTVAYNLEVAQNQQQQQKQYQQQHGPLAQFRPAVAASALFNKIINQQQQPRSLPHHVANADTVNNNKNIVWPTDGSVGEQDFELSHGAHEAEDLETTNISNGDYMLTADHQSNPGQHQHQQHQHQQHQHQHHPRALFEPHEDVVNVEAVLLQNQVDTLQWQLKQVETSCEMYRAVMEEVARFLNRYHSQKHQQLLDRSNMEQITRSKSMHHVFVGEGEGGGGGGGDDDGYEKLDECSHELSAASCLRARSSTNLVDAKQAPKTTKTLSKKSKPPKSGADDHLYDVIASAKNYNDFKDYTWRRSPKKLREYNPHSTDADVEAKLNQEAFRLSRTITNLLSTSMQQPDLTQHHSSLATGSLGRLRKMPASTSNMPLSQPLHNSSGLSTIGSDSSTATFDTAGSKTNKPGTTTGPEMLFLRSMNMRDSRLSLRSSTDSSVHSTSSSSKPETDEDHSPFLPPPHMHSAPKPIPQLGSTTEDESGFSSISSFQDIGVPLSSTMISTRNSISIGAMAVHEIITDTSVLDSNTLGGVDFNADSRNSTLKAAPLTPLTPTQLSNVVGLPVNSATDMQQRWNSPSKTYRNAPNKFQQRFSTLSNDDSTMVLWV